jgi:hypothetical protein
MMASNFVSSLKALSEGKPGYGFSAGRWSLYGNGVSA